MLILLRIWYSSTCIFTGQRFTEKYWKEKNFEIQELTESTFSQPRVTIYISKDESRAPILSREKSSYTRPSGAPRILYTALLSRVRWPIAGPVAPLLSRFSSFFAPLRAAAPAREEEPSARVLSPPQKRPRSFLPKAPKERLGCGAKNLFVRTAAAPVTDFETFVLFPGLMASFRIVRFYCKVKILCITVLKIYFANKRRPRLIINLRIKENLTVIRRKFLLGIKRIDNRNFYDAILQPDEAVPSPRDYKSLAASRRRISCYRANILGTHAMSSSAV